MKIQKDTWHYELWIQTFNYRSDAPEQTNLCSYCQRVFGRLLYLVIMGGGLIFAVGLILFMLFECFWKHTAITCGTFGSLVIIVGLGHLIARWRQERSFEPKPPPSLFSQWLSAKKQKVCPLVEFEE